jgi:hypothetical protein
MKQIEIIVMAENVQEVKDALTARDIETRSIKDLEFIANNQKRDHSEGCCGQGKKSPSMLKKAKNYAKTMARWIKAGRPIVELRELASRLSICGGCASLKGYECTECGCPMDSKAKMNIDKLCELNKW